MVVVGGKIRRRRRRWIIPERPGNNAGAPRRGAGVDVKYWVRPDIENQIKAKQITGLFNTRVKEFAEEYVVVENQSGEMRLPAKQSFALTGYHPDYTFIKSHGSTAG